MIETAVAREYSISAPTFKCTRMCNQNTASPVTLLESEAFSMIEKMKNNIAGWLYVLPSFLLLITFFIIPICRSFYYSLTDYSVLSSPVFCGFKNYVTALKDSFVQASLKNTCIYVLVTVPMQTILSMIIAAVIAMKFQNKYGRFVKACLFIPVISSSALSERCLRCCLRQTAVS